MLTTSPKLGAPAAFGLLTAACAVLAVACGNGDSAGSPGPTPSPPKGAAAAEFSEGTLAITIDMLDVGLLKGNVSAEASSEHRVTAVTVAAVDPKGTRWKVLEFPEGLGSREASEFFEVVLQELPRSQQIEVTATATFQDGDGAKVEREVKDYWPP
jgi:hypothetical protein